jgi:hypothetical protein
MRAKEFLSENGGKNVTINIPITITIPSGGGDPVVAAAASEELPPEPVNVFPLQQEIELRKRENGKTSKVINQILDDNGAFSESTQKTMFDISEDLDELYAEFNRST